MADQVSLFDLKLGARRICDRENDDSIDPDEETQYANESIQWVTRQLVKCFGHERFSKNKTYTSTGVSEYALPTDFWMLYRVERQYSSTDRRKMSPYMPFESSALYGTSEDFVWMPTPRYRLVGETISFLPAPSSGMVINISYVPVPPRLARDQDVWDCIAGWDELAKVDMAIKLKTKIEEDPGILVQRLATLQTDLTELAGLRDMGEPERIAEPPGGWGL